MFIAGRIAARTGAGTMRPTMERTSRPGHTSMDTRISPSMDTHFSQGGDTIVIAITSNPILGVATGTGQSSDRARKKARHLLTASKLPAVLSASFEINPEVVMNEKIKSEMMISRRGTFSLLGLAAAASVVVPATMLIATDAEARVGNPGSAVSVAGANRRDRRDDRRSKKKKKKPTEEIGDKK